LIDLPARPFARASVLFSSGVEYLSRREEKRRGRVDLTGTEREREREREREEFFSRFLFTRGLYILFTRGSVHRFTEAK